MGNELSSGLVAFVVFFAAALIGVAVLSAFNKKCAVKSHKAMLVKKTIEFGKLSTQMPQVPRHMLDFIYYDSSNKKKKISFLVNEACYIDSPENIYGTLSFQGTELLSFEGNGFKVDYTM